MENLWKPIQNAPVGVKNKIYNFFFLLKISFFLIMMRIIKSILKRFSLVITSIFLYLPVIAGILIPMVLILGIDMYISWRLIGYSFTSWTWAYYIIPSHLIPLIISIEILIFSLGLLLFLIGIITLVKKKIEGESIIQSGIYSYIRHPQNIGIIFMAYHLLFMSRDLKILG